MFYKTNVRNVNINFTVKQDQLHIPFPSQMYQFHIQPHYLIHLRPLSYYLPIYARSFIWLSSAFSDQSLLCILCLYSARLMCSIHLTLFHLVILKMFYEEWKLWTFNYRNFFPSPITSLSISEYSPRHCALKLPPSKGFP